MTTYLKSSRFAIGPKMARRVMRPQKEKNVDHITLSMMNIPKRKNTITTQSSSGMADKNVVAAAASTDIPISSSVDLTLWSLVFDSHADRHELARCT